MCKVDLGVIHKIYLLNAHENLIFPIILVEVTAVIAKFMLRCFHICFCSTKNTETYCIATQVNSQSFIVLSVSLVIGCTLYILNVELRQLVQLSHSFIGLCVCKRRMVSCKKIFAEPYIFLQQLFIYIVV